MAVDFRGHPMFPSTGFNAPTRFEADIYDCEVRTLNDLCNAYPPCAFDIRCGHLAHAPMTAHIADVDRLLVS